MKTRWEIIRGTAIIFAILTLLVGGGLFYVLTILLQADEKLEAHWATIGGIVGYIAGFGTAFANIAHMRADESPPQMDVNTALEFARLIHESSSSGDTVLKHDEMLNTLHQNLKGEGNDT